MINKQKPKGACKLCGENKLLCKAHVIPKGICKKLSVRQGEIYKLSVDPKEHRKRFQTGVYDTNILCADCDNGFGSWDDYACELLYDNFDKKFPLQKTPQGRDFHFVTDFDYQKFKLFFLSVLWRMHVSGYFSGVNLGPFEPQLRELLNTKSPSEPETFPVILFRYSDEGIGQKVMMGTKTSRRQCGCNSYDIGLPGYMASIKVDKQSLPKEMDILIMRPGKPFIVGAGDIAERHEMASVVKILRQQPDSRETNHRKRARA